MPLAMFPASPDVEKALPAMLEAWLNLSHREKANELVMVRAIAIAIGEGGGHTFVSLYSYVNQSGSMYHLLHGLSLSVSVSFPSASKAQKTHQPAATI